MSDDLHYLETIGYIKLDENLVQRLKNGRDAVLSHYGNSAATGRLAVGAVVVGLEQAFKEFLGANGLDTQNPPAKAVVAFLQQFSNESGEPIKTTPEIEKLAGEKKSNEANPSNNSGNAAEPDGDQDDGDDAHPTIANVIDEIKDHYMGSKFASQNDAEPLADFLQQQAIETKKLNQNSAYLKALKAFAQQHPNEEAAKVILGFISTNESKMLQGEMLSEAAPSWTAEELNDGEVFEGGWPAIRKVFLDLARLNYNRFASLADGAGGANPAAKNNSKGDGAGTPPDGDAPEQKPNDKPEHTHQNFETRPIDFHTLYNRFQTFYSRDFQLILDMAKDSQYANARELGMALKQSGILRSDNDAYILTAMLLQAIEGKLQ